MFLSYQELEKRASEQGRIIPIIEFSLDSSPLEIHNKVMDVLGIIADNMSFSVVSFFVEAPHQLVVLKDTLTQLIVSTVFRSDILFALQLHTPSDDSLLSLLISFVDKTFPDLLRSHHAIIGVNDLLPNTFYHTSINNEYVTNLYRNSRACESAATIVTVNWLTEEDDTGQARGYRLDSSEISSLRELLIGLSFVHISYDLWISVDHDELIDCTLRKNQYIPFPQSAPMRADLPGSNYSIAPAFNNTMWQPPDLSIFGMTSSMMPHEPTMLSEIFIPIPESPITPCIHPTIGLTPKTIIDPVKLHQKQDDLSLESLVLSCLPQVPPACEPQLYDGFIRYDLRGSPFDALFIVCRSLDNSCLEKYTLVKLPASLYSFDRHPASKQTSPITGSRIRFTMAAKENVSSLYTTTVYEVTEVISITPYYPPNEYLTVGYVAVIDHHKKLVSVDGRSYSIDDSTFKAGDLISATITNSDVTSMNLIHSLPPWCSLYDGEVIDSCVHRSIHKPCQTSRLLLVRGSHSSAIHGADLIICDCLESYQDKIFGPVTVALDNSQISLGKFKDPLLWANNMTPFIVKGDENNVNLEKKNAFLGRIVPPYLISKPNTLKRNVNYAALAMFPKPPSSEISSEEDWVKMFPRKQLTASKDIVNLPSTSTLWMLRLDQEQNHDVFASATKSYDKGLPVYWIPKKALPPALFIDTDPMSNNNKYPASIDVVFRFSHYLKPVSYEHTQQYPISVGRTPTDAQVPLLSLPIGSNHGVPRLPVLHPASENDSRLSSQKYTVSSVRDPETGLFYITIPIYPTIVPGKGSGPMLTSAKNGTQKAYITSHLEQDIPPNRIVNIKEWDIRYVRRACAETLPQNTRDFSNTTGFIWVVTSLVSNVRFACEAHETERDYEDAIIEFIRAKNIDTSKISALLNPAPNTVLLYLNILVTYRDYFDCNEMRQLLELADDTLNFIHLNEANRTTYDELHTQASKLT